MLILCIFILLLLLSLYVLSMYMEWRSTEQEIKAIDLVRVEAMIDTVTRDVRKGLYFAGRTARNATYFGTRTAQKIFFSVFPRAQHAFKERDKMTGLQSGPSSYFLLELSDFQTKKTSRRNQKNMQ